MLVPGSAWNPGTGGSASSCDDGASSLMVEWIRGGRASGRGIPGGAWNERGQTDVLVPGSAWNRGNGGSASSCVDGASSLMVEWNRGGRASGRGIPGGAWNEGVKHTYWFQALPGILVPEAPPRLVLMVRPHSWLSRIRGGRASGWGIPGGAWNEGGKHTYWFQAPPGILAPEAPPRLVLMVRPHSWLSGSEEAEPRDGAFQAEPGTRGTRG
jgi:hypothetical protein